MKPKLLTGIVIILSLNVIHSCTPIICLVVGENPIEIKKACETPEPGTYIDPINSLIAAKGITYFASPDSVYNRKKKVLELIKPKIKLSIDTTVLIEDFSLPMRIYCNISESRRENLPVIVYYHGGGFIWGSLDVFDGYCRKLARETRAIVIAPEYRLAPEFPYPYPVNDSYEALKWVSDNAKWMGGDPNRLIVMGGSAGGNIAAVMALMANDNDGPELYAQILCYPPTTFEDTFFPSREYFLRSGKQYLLNLEYFYKVKSAYLPDITYEKDRYVSPLLTEVNNELPAALIITAAADPLRDEGRLYAEKLRAAGNQVTYWECEGMIHSFLPFYPLIPESRYIIREIARYIANLD